MKEVQVKTPSKEYTISITDSFNSLNLAWKNAKNGKMINQKVCIISDSNVSKLYLDEVSSILKPHSLELSSFVFEAGEKNKNNDTIMDIISFFMQKKLDRNSVVVALGGGVTGDMAGFASAIYMRGISFVQIPTSLLAQVDSSSGGKVGVDFNDNKNMIGAFHQPELVYINVSTLNTLPKIEFSCGMAEIIKHGLIQDYSYYKYLQDSYTEIISLNVDHLIDMVEGSCKVKSNVVSQDEKEHGIRAILNFGHTFGHSIETLSNFTLNHGQCVSIGMVAALFCSLELNKITKTEFDEAINTITKYDLPVNLSKNYNIDANSIKDQMYLDKKTNQNILNIVVLDNIGDAYILKKPPIDIVEKAIDFVSKNTK